MTQIPFLKRANKAKSDAGYTGKQSEKKVTKRLGGSSQIGSGALDGRKGDVVLPDFLVEAKATEKDSMSLKYSWLSKIKDEAQGENKHPALAVTFTDYQGNPLPDGAWVMVPERIFKELTNG